MHATIHAIVLLSIPVFSIFSCIKFGELPFHWKKLIYSCGRSFLTLLVSGFLLYGLRFSCLCGPGNNPSSQLWIPLLSAITTSFFVKKVALRRSLISLFVIMGIILSSDFHSLVLDSQSCSYTGDSEYIENSCNVSATAYDLWHTSFTGIYGVKKSAM